MIAVAILVVVYGIFQARNLINGPEIAIFTPANGSELTAALVNISGNAQNIASITLNGKSIKVNPKGDFSEPLLLTNGYNIISIKAEDRFKRTTEKQLQLIYKQHGV